MAKFETFEEYFEYEDEAKKKKREIIKQQTLDERYFKNGILYSNCFIELNPKEKCSIDELKKMANALRKFLKEKGEKKDWKGWIYIIGSQTDGKKAKKEKIPTGGRRKTIYIPQNKRKQNTRTHAHMHLLVSGNPHSSIAREIERYWQKTKEHGERTSYDERKTYYPDYYVYDLNGCKDYMDEQKDFERYIDFDKDS